MGSPVPSQSTLHRKGRGLHTTGKYFDRSLRKRVLKYWSFCQDVQFSILGEHDRLPQNTLHTVLSMLTTVIMTLAAFHSKIYHSYNHCFLLLSSLLSCYIAIIQTALHIPLTYHIYYYVHVRSFVL